MTTITKRGFFTALIAAVAAAIAKAQTTIITPCRPKIQWGGQIPLCNGQCPNPECGYRAPEFENKRYAYGIKITDQAGVSATYDRLGTEEIEKPGVVFWNPDNTPKYRLNRCPNCNTAFWQDPQEEKG